MNWLTAPVVVPLLCGTMLIITLMRIAVPIGQPVTGTMIGCIRSVSRAVALAARQCLPDRRLS